MTNATLPEPGVLALTVLWGGRLLAWFVVLCALLPFIRTGWWVVRVCDFPRLQLAAVCLLTILFFAGFAWRYGWRTEFTITSIALALALLWQAWHVAKYTPLWPTTVPSSENTQLKLLVTNLDYENTRHEDVVAALLDVDPDVLLIVEIDERWQTELAEVRSRYPYRTEAIRGKGLGIAFWSKLPKLASDIQHRVTEDRPSTWATVDLAGRPVRFVGLHPTPPGLEKRGDEGRHNSRMRDAELVLIARDVADHPDAIWIVAGDFNDVAWSHTTRLFERLSGLADPRVGRGMYSTYHAEYPLLRYPLDHVFLSEGIDVAHLARIRIPGSDHFAMLAELDLSNAGEGVHPESDSEDRQEAADMVDDGLDDASDANE